MTAYYNEIDPFKAAVLREAIKAGAIAPGDVDERSIADVRPNDLREYTQCHFFAGGGFWSLALRQAGWPDDRPVWTGSCPCQPFSAAGKGAGTSDERHLWPAFFHLIEQCRPPVLLGEQVEAAIRHGWLDLVQDDLEGIGYSTAAIGFPAAGVGAPHIRQRLYFAAEIMGDPEQSGLAQRIRERRISGEKVNADAGQATKRTSVHAGCLADADGRDSSAERQQPCREQRFESEDGLAGGLADAGSERRQQVTGSSSRNEEEDGREGWNWSESNRDHQPSGHGETGGFWRDADWIYCRDEKYRPVEPGTFPLAHGGPARVGRLRMYGDAIVVPQAQAFIEAYLAEI